MQISKLTLSLFDDMGWYFVKYDDFPDLSWGKNKGCDFVNPKF